LKNNSDIYLLAFYTLKPRDANMTKVKGYMSNPENVYYDEMVNITRGLKNKISVDAKIILNLSKKSVVKNTWQTEKTWDELYAYFEEGYSKYINTVMNPTGD
jgi:hypothetical protein